MRLSIDRSRANGSLILFFDKLFVLLSYLNDSNFNCVTEYCVIEELDLKIL